MQDPRGRAIVMKSCRPYQDKFIEDIDLYYELLHYNVAEFVWLNEC